MPASRSESGRAALPGVCVAGTAAPATLLAGPYVKPPQRNSSERAIEM